MSLCDYHILSNGTFSWWGAWLGENNTKKTFYPDPWFDHDGKDLCFTSWERVPKYPPSNVAPKSSLITIFGKIVGWDPETDKIIYATSGMIPLEASMHGERISFFIPTIEKYVKSISLEGEPILSDQEYFFDLVPTKDPYLIHELFRIKDGNSFWSAGNGRKHVSVLSDENGNDKKFYVNYL